MLKTHHSSEINQLARARNKTKYKANPWHALLRFSVPANYPSPRSVHQAPSQFLYFKRSQVGGTTHAANKKTTVLVLESSLPVVIYLFPSFHIKQTPGCVLIAAQNSQNLGDQTLLRLCHELASASPIVNTNERQRSSTYQVIPQLRRQHVRHSVQIYGEFSGFK